MSLDIRTVLSNQVDTVLAQIGRERQRVAVSRGTRATPVVPEPPLSLPVVPLDSELAATHRDLQALSERLATAADLRAAFAELQTLRERAQNLFGECLAVATAPVVRAQNLDQGACRVADRLLAEIGEVVGIPWSHFTILAESEFFGRSAQLVRLRYPAPSIWQLPIAVHELGHFCGPNWPPSRHGDPYEACMAQADLGHESFREEYFADLFAVFVLGIPYACACLLERFQPLQGDSKTHPADAKRALWILHGLELLADQAEGESRRLGRGWSAKLRECWQHGTAACGITVSAADSERLRHIALQIWTKFVRVRPAAAYRDLQGALALKADFAERRSRMASAKVSLRDVIAASWLIRLELGDRAGHESLRFVEQWADALCRV